MTRTASSSSTALPSSDAPRICEDLGLGLPAELDRRLRAPFEAEELEQGFRRAGLRSASPVAAGRSPIAVWVLGPSAVGKSTVASKFAVDLGVPPRSCKRDELDAVQIDGDLLRLEHTGYQEVVRHGLDQGCVWHEAYPALRSQLRDGKESLLRQAVSQRQNLVIPHTCQRLEHDCLGPLRELVRAGYTNHIVMVQGDREEIQRRGEQRAQALGKRYAAEEYDASLRSFEPMARHANGQVLSVWNTGSHGPRVISRSQSGVGIGSDDAAGKSLAQHCTEAARVAVGCSR